MRNFKGYQKLQYGLPLTSMGSAGRVGVTRVRAGWATGAREKNLVRETFSAWGRAVLRPAVYLSVLGGK